MTTLKSQHRTGVTTGYLSNVVKSKFKFQCARGLLWGAPAGAGARDRELAAGWARCGATGMIQPATPACPARMWLDT